ncbi:hypothetical protein [Streptomyces sp. NPDC048242]|uniref:hypothetical protein n=1 Tax=Streptomyces sp. NPDC048242 TaxID=3155026 RepID=UPI003449181C
MDLDFQLVLLRRLADHHPELAEDARLRLGASLTEMREVNRRWQAMARSKKWRSAAERYRVVLGAPEVVEAREVGGMACEAWQWGLSLWPDLRFEVLVGEGGAVLTEWLVRRPEAAVPLPRTLEDLTGWSYTLDEVARAFAPVRPVQSTAPTRQALVFTAPDRDGTPHEVAAEFTWGLLQRTALRD